MEISNADLLAKMKSLTVEINGDKKSIEDINSNSQAFKQALDKVNQLQENASSLKEQYELGDSNVSLAQVMIASQKASVAFQATLQIRNKIIEAYKDIMNMPI